MPNENPPSLPPSPERLTETVAQAIFEYSTAAKEPEDFSYGELAEIVVGLCASSADRLAEAGQELADYLSDWEPAFSALERWKEALRLYRDSASKEEQ